MLGTLSTHTAAPAARRVDPAVALRGVSSAPDAGAPSRQGAPDTARPETVAGALAAVARSRAEPGSIFAALAEGEGGERAGDGRAAAARPAAGPGAPSPLVSPPVSPPFAASAGAASPLAAAVLSRPGAGLPSAAGAAAVASAAVAAAGAPAADGGPAAAPAAARAADPLQAGLSEEELAVVAQMAQRDKEVREHEMAHVDAGRPWAGPAVYLYQTGPDGRRYAIGGFAPIDVSPIEGNPEATAAKMRIVIEGALAASPPSSADRHVAALARSRLQAALAAISEASRLARQGDEAGAEAARNAVSARI